MKCDECGGDMVKGETETIKVGGIDCPATNYECPSCLTGNDSGLFHCVPVDESEIHSTGLAPCWCNPIWEEDGEECIVMHNSLEEFEPFNESS